MKEDSLFNQIESKKKRNFIWLVVLLAALIVMILLTIVCPTNENIGLTKMPRLFPPFILAIILYLWQEARYYFIIYKNFNGSIFSAHPKRQRITNPEKYELITYKNRILYRKHNDHKDEGEIVLDLINLKYGKGFHIMNTDDDDPVDYSYTDRFGFSQFIISRNKIYVENPYIKPDKKNIPYGEILYQVFVWIKEDKD